MILVGSPQLQLLVPSPETYRLCQHNHSSFGVWRADLLFGVRVHVGASEGP